MDYNKRKEFHDEEHDYSSEEEFKNKKNGSKIINKKKIKKIKQISDDEDQDVISNKESKISRTNIDQDDNDLDDEAEDDEDEDEDEDEDDEAHAEEFNDFIDDNEVENEEGEVDDEIKNKKRKKDKKHKKKQNKNNETSIRSSNSENSSSSSQEELSELEEDDLELIKDNLNVENLEEVGIKVSNKFIKILNHVLFCCFNLVTSCLENKTYHSCCE
jgi:hypothetical protein